MIPMITVLHVHVGVYKLFSPFSGLNPELVMTYNVHSVALSSVSKVMLLSRADLKIRLKQGRSMMFETEPCHYRVAGLTLPCYTASLSHLTRLFISKTSFLALAKQLAIVLCTSKMSIHQKIAFLCRTPLSLIPFILGKWKAAQICRDSS